MGGAHLRLYQESFRHLFENLTWSLVYIWSIGKEQREYVIIDLRAEDEIEDYFAILTEEDKAIDRKYSDDSDVNVVDRSADGFQANIPVEAQD